MTTTQSTFTAEQWEHERSLADYRESRSVLLSEARHTRAIGSRYAAAFVGGIQQTMVETRRIYAEDILKSAGRM